MYYAVKKGHKIGIFENWSEAQSATAGFSEPDFKKFKTKEEAEELLQATYQNPMIDTVKCPSVQGGMLENAKFRVSKRTSEMHKTGLDEDTSKSKWKVSFNLMQKELTAQQKATVNRAKGLS